MTRLALVSFVLASTLALPSAAQANPAALAMLQTVAVASDPGVAQALVTPEAAPAGTTTTQVTVAVSTESGPQPATAAAVPPADETVRALSPYPYGE
jgi:hypothetical protein